MRKLRLDPEMLHVESFTPREDDAPLRGTVQANSHVSDMVPSGCCPGDKSMYCQPTDFAVYSCGTSCQFHCLPTFYEPTCADC